MCIYWKPRELIPWILNGLNDIGGGENGYKFSSKILYGKHG